MRNSSEAGRRGETAPRHVKINEVEKVQPEWLVQELLKQNRRRHTVTLGDKPQILRQQHRSAVSTQRLCSLKVHF